MSFPIRCFSCGAVIGQNERKYESMLENGLSCKDALDTLKIKRYCCRRMFLGHINIIDKVNLFPKRIQTVSEAKK